MSRRAPTPEPRSEGRAVSPDSGSRSAPLASPASGETIEAIAPEIADELAVLRREIDAIDGEILDRLNRRARCVQRVGEGDAERAHLLGGQAALVHDALGQGGAGLGTMWGWETAEAVLKAAGFAGIERTVLPHDPMNVWFVSRKD